jgi:hypothetical protein
MQIRIKDLQGKVIFVNFEPENTVEQVKQFLMEKVGIPSDQIRLIKGGKQMPDESRLQDFGVKAGDIIHQVLQLRGGM